MLAADELVITVLGKTESVIYPSYVLAADQSVTSLSFVGEEVGGIRTRDWRLLDTNRADGIYRMVLAAPPVYLSKGPEVVSAFVRGVTMLEVDKGAIPPFFSPPALRAIRSAMSVYRDGVASIRYESREGTVHPTKHTAARIKDILLGERVRHTTIRGRLSGAWVREESSVLRASIQEQITGRKITCKLAADRDLISRVGAALNQRVAVSGYCTYAKTGDPVSIQVTNIRVLAPIDPSQMPPLRLTDEGEDAADFVRRMRDAQ